MTWAFQPSGTCGGGDAADAAATQVDGAVVGDRFACSVGEVVDRHHAPDRSVGDLRFRYSGEEEVHSAALVGFEVTEHGPAQPFQWRNDGFGYDRELGAWPGVEDGRVVGVYKELVEGEAGRPDVRHERGLPVDAVGDLVNVPTRPLKQPVRRISQGETTGQFDQRGVDGRWRFQYSLWDRPGRRLHGQPMQSFLGLPGQCDALALGQPVRARRMCRFWLTPPEIGRRQ